MDENEFFREATLRICGNLEIDKALRSCLLYIREYIPADFMGFVVYLPEQESYETIAAAYLDGSNTLPVLVPVPPQHRRQLRTDITEPRITVTNRIGKDDAAQALIRHLHWPYGASIAMEMVLTGKRMGALIIINEKQTPYTSDHVRLLKLLNEPLGIALTNSLRYRKVRELKNLLADDKRYLQDELFRMKGQQIIGSAGGLKAVMEAVRKVAPSGSPVLLLGETGVGKEVIAKAIHNSSPRREGPFITVNCGAITESLIDSELFGHEKGAFTGAVAGKRGRFERADGGTIFLDEIGELPLEAQVRLLRVLQDKEIERVGGEAPMAVDSRVIAATHRDLEQMIRHGQFREDLYFRLKVFPLEIPPLRRRKLDIPALVQHFLREKAKELAIPGMPTLSPGALDGLMAYDWPGNVRELENAVERALIICGRQPLTFSDLQRSCGMDHPAENEPPFPVVSQLDAVITAHIRKTLDRTRGRIEGPNGAAALLNIHPATLRQKMRKLGIPFGRKARALYQPRLFSNAALSSDLVKTASTS
ncbi:MAG: sigma-54 interaction domain-containing protein [Thermodesulfobacteriota bacterium]